MTFVLTDAQRRQYFIDELLPHQEALTAFAGRLAQNSHDAADLVQVTYLNAFRYLHHYEPGTNAKAWLFRILRNAFVSEYNRRRQLPTVVNCTDAQLSGPSGQPGLSLSAEQRYELLDDVLGDEVTLAIGSLPVNLRIALLLRDFEDFSYTEIADILEIPLGTVRSRIHRARAQLQDKLRAYARSQGISDRREEEAEKGS